MAWDGTGTPVTTATYSAAGLTPANVEDRLAILWAGVADYATCSADQATRIDDAITAVGMAVETWDGTDWWWLRDTGSFPTVDGTVSYALRTVNTNDMANLWAVQRVYYDDDWALKSLVWSDYQDWYRLIRPNAAEQKPLGYTVTGEPPYLWLYPLPDTEYTLYVDYTKRHSKISAGAPTGGLIVPAEFQHGIYIDGAAWWLRHELEDAASLRDCPRFMEAINRMRAARPIRYGEDPNDLFPDAQSGTFPNDRRVKITEDGVHILNPYTAP